MSDNPITDALAQSRDGIFYALGNALRKAFPNSYLLETDFEPDSLMDFQESGTCKITYRTDFPNECQYFWDDEKGPYRTPYNAWLVVEWQGESLEVVQITVRGQHCEEHRSYVLAKNQEVAEAFFDAACKWDDEVHGEILVFSEGEWQKSQALFDSIKSTTLETLVLARSLKHEIVSDFHSFFDNKEGYLKHRIPWKRGVLFLGPPGNGKTHMVKGLVNDLGLPCLYVRSFTARYQTPESCISAAFKRARSAAPCIMVLEDLDAMIDDKNRSFFLNEMDGFYSNEGILTLATTNHPGRLDPAILERPSRFDRKYTFALPEVPERLAYATLVNAGLEAELQLTPEELARLAEGTSGFSFAYLKELFLSSMMSWIGRDGKARMVDILLEQTEMLSSQMTTELAMHPKRSPATAGSPDWDDSDE